MCSNYSKSRRTLSNISIIVDSSSGRKRRVAIKMESIKWKVRLMRAEDVDKCLRIWSKVELTEAKQTVLNHLISDPEAFYVAELEDTKEVIGMCSGCMTRPDTAFMGFYAVEPDFQNLGIGRALWAACLKRLNSSINIGLYGVPGMNEKYKRSGFQLEDSIRMLIYESQRNCNDKLNIEALKSIDALGSGCRFELLNRKTSKSLMCKLYDFDQLVHMYSRKDLLKLYLACNDAPLALAVVKDSKTATVALSSSEREIDGVAEWKSTMDQEQAIIIADEGEVSGRAKASLSISAEGSLEASGNVQTGHKSVADIPQTVANYDDTTACDFLGYGVIRADNNNGAMVGPIYAESSEVCEVILRKLLESFPLNSPNAGVYSIMALDSNEAAIEIMLKLGMSEMDQCTRMFTKFIPAASFSKIYFIHTPNFSLA